jgi:N-acetylglucosaminyldiphosphoundecaprenol N-acetyl-beta-D-mannosaminyltransferase
MALDYPNIKAIGTYSPPFKTEFNLDDNLSMRQSINRFRPDVLWVGMTAPKQEKWIYGNIEHLNVKFVGAVGAVFDFYTGNVKRSSSFFLNNGLEWLPRLLQEPRRLWKRNLVSAPKFFLRLIRSRLKVLP